MRRFALVWALAFVFVYGTIGFAQTTITFWHWNTPERQQVIDPLIDQFEAETGIRVDRQMVAWAELNLDFSA